MQTLFFVLSLSGLAYITFRKRRFDGYTVAYLAALIYFMPGYFGFTSYHVGANWERIPLAPETYAVMVLVIASILAGGVIYDFLPEVRGPNFASRTSRGAQWTCLVVAGVAGSLAVMVAGPALFSTSTDKAVMLSSLGHFYTAFAFATIFGACIAFERRSKWAIAVFLALLLFTVYLGFRLELAITAIAVVTLWLIGTREKRFRIVSLWKAAVPLAMLAYFFFLIKQLIFQIKLLNWGMVYHLLLQPDTYINAVVRSEPFVTQNILNVVITSNFHTGAGYIWDQLAVMFTLFGKAQSVTSFNDLFQPALFPSVVDYGMANNFWAQLWSAGGWEFLILGCIFFNLVLGIGSWLLKSRDLLVRVAAAVAMAIIAFYIHRNDLLYEIILVKRVFMIFFVVLVIGYLLTVASRFRTGVGSSYMVRTDTRRPPEQ